MGRATWIICRKDLRITSAAWGDSGIRSLPCQQRGVQSEAAGQKSACKDHSLLPGGASGRDGWGSNYDDEGWTTSAGWFRDRFNFGQGAGNFHPGTSPVRSRLSANLRNSRATGLGPYSVTASFTVTATPSSESLAFSCRSNQCLIDNATCATSCLSERLHRWPAPRPERRSKLMHPRSFAQAKRQRNGLRFCSRRRVSHNQPILRTWVLTVGMEFQRWREAFD